MTAFGAFREDKDQGDKSNYQIFSNGPYKLEGTWSPNSGGTFVRNDQWDPATDDVRKAVEHLFDVKVLRVNIQNRRGKPRRSRFRQGTTNSWKKAIVTLDKEHRINFF